MKDFSEFEKAVRDSYEKRMEEHPDDKTLEASIGYIDIFMPMLRGYHEWFHRDNGAAS